MMCLTVCYFQPILDLKNNPLLHYHEPLPSEMSL